MEVECTNTVYQWHLKRETNQIYVVFVWSCKVITSEKKLCSWFF